MKELYIDICDLKSKIEELNINDMIYLSGEIYTARDAAHKRMYEAYEKGMDMPISVKDQIIYYMGPSPARPGNVIGAAGPTTSSRMDLMAMIGKGKRSDEVREAVIKNKAAYFAAIGGAGALLSKCIQSSEIVAYEDLGTEAIRRLVVKDFPVITVLDTKGGDLYKEVAERCLIDNK